MGSALGDGTVSPERSPHGGTRGSREHMGGRSRGRPGLGQERAAVIRGREGSGKIQPCQELSVMVLGTIHSGGPGDYISVVGKASAGDHTLFGRRGSDLRTGATGDQAA